MKTYETGLGKYINVHSLMKDMIIVIHVVGRPSIPESYCNVINHQLSIIYFVKLEIISLKFRPSGVNEYSNKMELMTKTV